MAGLWEISFWELSHPMVASLYAWGYCVATITYGNISSLSGNLPLRNFMEYFSKCPYSFLFTFIKTNYHSPTNIDVIRGSSRSQLLETMKLLVFVYRKTFRYEIMTLLFLTIALLDSPNYLFQFTMNIGWHGMLFSSGNTSVVPNDIFYSHFLLKFLPLRNKIIENVQVLGDLCVTWCMKWCYIVTTNDYKLFKETFGQFGTKYWVSNSSVNSIHSHGHNLE